MKQGDVEKSGIFRFPPIIYLIPFIVGLLIHWAFPIRILPLGWLQLAVGLPIIGIALVFWTSATATLRRARTAIDPGGTTKVIVSHGPYGFSRNPLYLSLGVIYIGMALSINTAWLLIFLPLIFILISLVIRQEERYLGRKFGQEYLTYKAKVRRWL